MTKMELELIPNFDLYILFEKGTKGGISNKFLINILKAYKKSQLYDQKQESQHIIYLDAYIYMIMQRLNFFEQINSNG